MTDVWVIEAGSYSDYRVVGIFTSKENAEAVAALLKGLDSPSINKWPINPGLRAATEGYTRWAITMLRDGAVERAQPADPYELADSAFLWKRTEAPAYRGKGIPDALNATVWARDKKHAVKIANERRTRMIASGEWK